MPIIPHRKSGYLPRILCVLVLRPTGLGKNPRGVLEGAPLASWRIREIPNRATSPKTHAYSSFQLSEHISTAKDAKERKCQLIVLKLCLPS